MENRGETMPAPVPGVAWSTVPGSEIHLITPEESLLVNARFTAESACNGQAAGACVVRLIADSTAGITQLDPASGRDFAFDTDVGGAVDVDVEEGHAMERSRRLPAGSYDIRVECAVTNAATVFQARRSALRRGDEQVDPSIPDREEVTSLLAIRGTGAFSLRVTSSTAATRHPQRSARRSAAG
jgi:hypothetical protein